MQLLSQFRRRSRKSYTILSNDPLTVTLVLKAANQQERQKKWKNGKDRSVQVRSPYIRNHGAIEQGLSRDSIQSKRIAVDVCGRRAGAGQKRGNIFAASRQILTIKLSFREQQDAVQSPIRAAGRKQISARANRQPKTIMCYQGLLCFEPRQGFT